MSQNFEDAGTQWRRQDFSLGGRIEAPRGRGAKGAEGGEVRGFDYLILKWRILMHISGILTY